MESSSVEAPLAAESVGAEAPDLGGYGDLAERGGAFDAVRTIDAVSP